MGARAYRLIEEVSFNSGEIVVEIGSERGEGSTAYFTEYLKDKAPFYSIDIIKRTPETIVSDGVEWLKNNKHPIKFCYLDNFDYIFDHIVDEPWVAEQKKEYESLGIKLTNRNSELAHLEQSIYLEKSAVKGTVVLIDDTWRMGDEFYGKGALAVPYLLLEGWSLINDVGKNYKSYAALRREYE